MSERANVTSVEAIEAFRAKLIIYLSKARPTLEEISAEVSRTRNWLQNDRRVYWEHQIRRRTKLLEDARQSLYTARTANLRDNCTAEQQAVRVAERGVQEAEEKLKVVKKWTREFDTRVLPLLRPLEKLNTLLTNTLPHGVLYLGQVVKTLHEYSGTVAPTLDDSPPPPSLAPVVTEKASEVPAESAPVPASGGAA